VYEREIKREKPMEVGFLHLNGAPSTRVLQGAGFESWTFSRHTPPRLPLGDAQIKKYIDRKDGFLLAVE